MISSWGGMSPPKDLKMVKPIERILHSGLFGPWDRPDIKGILPDELPPAINPGRHSTWGQDSFEFFPNFTLLFWAPGWYLTYNYWPTGVDSHIFEADLYFVPPKNLRQRLSQELAAVTFKEYAFQDANTLEATQTQIGTARYSTSRCATRKFCCATCTTPHTSTWTGTKRPKPTATVRPTASTPVLTRRMK